MNKLRLPRDGAEYAHFDFSPSRIPDDVVIEAQIAGTWYALERPVGAAPRLLLRGPDAPAGAGGVLVPSDQPIRVRVRDNPEIVVRGGGQITLVR